MLSRLIHCYNPERKQLLKPDKYKDIIVSSLEFLVNEKRVKVYGFVPIAIGMSNHIHVVWQVQQGYAILSLILELV